MTTQRETVHANCGINIARFDDGSPYMELVLFVKDGTATVPITTQLAQAIGLAAAEADKQHREKNTH